jgi:hypothetical protein
MSAQPKINSREPQVEQLDDFKPISKNSASNTILGKRKFNDAFHEQTFDDARYGQHIDINFFQANIGHSVPQKQISEKDIERKDDVKIFSNKEEEDILKWCEYYRANRNLFNV